ncbi:hypothetical protein [Halomarina litorea]|uniref:hypothetical protein n=1 Tax=Halomarina litorea TaxID=2961595 RepID=UPI0020C41584|nr:hypothetical protein [Halomarina sp. BCD28]
MIRSAATYLLVLLLVTSGAAVPVAASGAAPAASPLSNASTASGFSTAAPETASLAPVGTSGGTIAARYEVTRVDGGAVRVRMVVRTPSNLASLTADLPDGVRVESTDGFGRTGEGTYEWSGGSPSSITYVVDLGSDPDVPSGPDWMLVDRWDVSGYLSWSYWGSAPDYDAQVALGPNQSGTVGSTMALLGETTETSDRSTDQEFRVVVSDEAGMRHGTDELFDVLHAANEGLAVGARDDRVNLFYVPSIPRYAGWASGNPTGGEHDVTVEAGVWKLVTVHEYVHTRQAFAHTGEMGWVVEGSADYYEYLIGLHNGDISYAEFHRRVTTDRDAGATLTDPDTWADWHTKYTKGRRVVAALDARLREETGGEASFQDVFYRMNTHDEVLTYDAFRGIVVDVGGDSFGPWLDRYVDGSDAPPVPDDRSLFTSTVVADSDSDGLPDTEERALGTDALTPDTDGDDLSDGTEVEIGSDPLVGDTDDDTLTDRDEYDRGTDPTSNDTDGDGLNDGSEVRMELDPLTPDTDGDGLPDGDEVDRGSNPRKTDTDGDGLDDAFEADVGTDPTAADTDDDGLDDAAESAGPTSTTRADTDGDGLDDGAELDRGTDPVVADTDGDGLPDGEEVDIGSDPLRVDTDGDGLDDGREVDVGTDPTETDTDGDGLDDGTERDGPTDPLADDTDGDGLSDGNETTRGSDPLRVDTDGDGLPDGIEDGLDTDLAVTDTDGDGYDDAHEDDIGTDPTADTGGIEHFFADLAASLRGLF